MYVLDLSKNNIKRLSRKSEYEKVSQNLLVNRINYFRHEKKIMCMKIFKKNVIKYLFFYTISFEH